MESRCLVRVIDVLRCCRNELRSTEMYKVLTDLH